MSAVQIFSPSYINIPSAEQQLVDQSVLMHTRSLAKSSYQPPGPALPQTAHLEDLNPFILRGC